MMPGDYPQVLFAANCAKAREVIGKNSRKFVKLVLSRVEVFAAGI